MIEDKSTPSEDPKPAAASEPAPVAQTVSDYDRDRSRRRTVTLIMASLLLGGIGVAYFYVGRKPPVVTPAPQMQQSEAVFTSPPPRPSQSESVPGRLVYDPIIVDFGTLRVNEGRKVVSITVTAAGGPVRINSISLPFAQQSGIDMRAEGCVDKHLIANDRCAVVLTFSPTTPINLSNSIIINATGYDAGGSTQGRDRSISDIIEITGQAVTPPAPPPAPVVIDRDAGQLDASREAFLRARQRAGGLSQQADGNGWRAPRQTDRTWQSAGFQPTTSTLPVDMSRIVTMDKPIPAVIKTTIDTRHPSRAVATVERDVYGGDGRIVVIERGSTLIGQVGSVGEASEEKVAIVWQRVVRPDGVAFGLRASSGNASGQSGVNALIDNRFFDRFGRTFLASLFTGGVTIALGGTTQQTQSAGTTGSSTTTTYDARAIAGQQIRQDMLPVFEQYRREQLALPVLRIIPAGTRITVWASTDLILAHPETEQTPVAQNNNALSSQTAARTRAQSAATTDQIYAPPAPAPAPAVAPDGNSGAIIPSAEAAAVPIGNYGGAAMRDTSLPSETASQRNTQQLRAADQARAQGRGLTTALTIQSPAGQIVIPTPWSAAR